ncbi:MAG: type II toxin-antitoxin system HicA family toxin [Pseudonocardiaceae bacterium]
MTRVIESLDFVHVRTKSSHVVYRHPDGRALVIPNTAPSSEALWARSCGKPGITPAEFLELLH